MTPEERAQIVAMHFDAKLTQTEIIMRTGRGNATINKLIKEERERREAEKQAKAEAQTGDDNVAELIRIVKENNALLRRLCAELGANE